jgi:hypothetical protein
LDVATRVNTTKVDVRDKEVTPVLFDQIGKFLEDTGLITKMGEEAPAAPKAALPKEQVAKINAAWLKDPLITEPWELDIHGNVIDARTRNIIGHMESQSEMAARAKAEGLIGRPGGSPPLIPKPVVPRLASGEAYGNLAKTLGFDLDGRNVDMAAAWKDVKAELEALDIFNKCNVV